MERYCKVVCVLKHHTTEMVGEGKVPYILNLALDGGEQSVTCLLVRIISVCFTLDLFSCAHYTVYHNNTVYFVHFSIHSIVN
jgi:hypothetical protein